MGIYPVNITFDVRWFLYGHRNRKEGNEYARRNLRRFNQRINCIHCSDIHPSRGIHLAIGHGVNDWQGILEELNSIGYEGDLIIESMNTPYIISSILKLRSLLKKGYQ